VTTSLPKRYHNFLCFFGRASRYLYVIKTNLMHCLSSVYFVNQPLHVSGIFVAHHQEIYSIYTTIGTCCANRQSNKKHNTYQLLYIYSIPPDNGLQIFPKHVDVYWRNKLRINSASSWFPLHRDITIVVRLMPLHIWWQISMKWFYMWMGLGHFLSKTDLCRSLSPLMYILRHALPN
jgi:hypothetical protein